MIHLQSSFIYGITTLMLCSSAYGQTTLADVCVRVVDRAVRNINISNSSSAVLNSTFDRFCSSNGSVKDTGGTLEIGFPVGDIPVSLTGGFTDKKKAAESFCRNYSTTSAARSDTKTYNETIVARAYDTLDECIANLNKGVSITHAFITNEHLQITGSASTGVQVEFRGVTTSNDVKCKGRLNGQLIDWQPNTLVKSSDTIAVDCFREPTITTGGEKQFGESSISVAAATGNYTIFWPRDARISENLASRIETSLASLNARLAQTNAETQTINQQLNAEKVAINFTLMPASGKCPDGWQDTGEIGFLYKGGNPPPRYPLGSGWTGYGAWMHPRTCMR